jgi:hypothetical protein
MDRRRRCGGRLPTPQQVHQPVQRDDLTPVQCQCRKHRPLLAGTEVDRRAIAQNLESTQHADMHLRESRTGLRDPVIDTTVLVLTVPTANLPVLLGQTVHDRQR